MRHLNKRIWKIPFGEIQYGIISRSIIVWFRGKKYIIKKNSKKIDRLINGS